MGSMDRDYMQEKLSERVFAKPAEASAVHTLFALLAVIVCVFTLYKLAPESFDKPAVGAMTQQSGRGAAKQVTPYEEVQPTTPSSRKPLPESKLR
jgi:hypothetical protein